MDQATLNANLLPILAAALDGIDNEGLRTAITGAYTTGLANAAAEVQQQVFNVQLATDPQGVYDQLAAGLTEPVTVSVDADVTDAKASVNTLGTALGGKGWSDGANYAQGLADGIYGKVESAKAAARSSATR